MYYFFFIFFCSLILPSCSDDGTSSRNSTPENPSDTINIGSQIWTSKNLDVDSFQNGDKIKYVDDYTFLYDTVPMYCYLDFDSTNGKKFGKLYNWYAISDTRGLAPKGYHIPNNNEWSTLINFLGGKQDAGCKLKANYGWLKNGNNESKLGLVPGGYMPMGAVAAYPAGFHGYWWTLSEYDSTMSWTIMLWNAENSSCYVETLPLYKSSYFYVRCIKD